MKKKLFNKNVVYWLVTFELDQMDRYLDLIQSSISERFDEIEAAYKNDMGENLSEDEAEMLEEKYTDEFIEIGRDFPKRLLSSFIVAWYSFVEQKMLDICVKLDLKIQVRPNDTENFEKGIRRARKFLLVAQEYEINARHWQELIAISRLRNFIVHEGTQIIGKYKKPDNVATITLKLDDGIDMFFPLKPDLYSYLQQHNIIEQSGMFLEIIPSFDYCKYLVLFGRDLFSKLYTDLFPNR